MHEFVMTMLSLSLSGSLVALVLFALRPLFQRSLSRTWHYYLWVLVLVRLLLPIGPQVSFMQMVGEQIAQPPVQSEVSEPSAARDAPTLRVDMDDETAWTQEELMTIPRTDSPTPSDRASFTLTGLEIAGIIWLGVTVVLLLRKILSYRGLMREIKRLATPCEDAALLQLAASLCRELNIPLQPPVYINHLVPPMLLGVFRPAIALPADCATRDDLRYILRHELVHFKRRDILYKWAAQIVACIHWFNPVIYLVQREIGRCCELACDEAVIRGISEKDRGCYGEAILSAIKPMGAKSYATVSLSMSADKRQLKERLIAIMRYKRKGRWAAAHAAMLTVLLLCGAAYAGAYTPRRQAAESGDSSTGTQSYNSTLPVDLSTVTIKGNTWYLIDTEEQLRGLGRGNYPLDAKYLLNGDITLDKTVDWIPVGTQEAPFTGTFNGNGCEIINLTITDPSVNIIGMFAYAENAEIYNVTLRSPDIEGAFTPGNSIAPILVFGKNCDSFDNQIIEPVERDAVTVSSTSVKHTESGYVSRTESLVQDFAPYTAYGIVYNPDSDTVTYHGNVVKLFVAFKPYGERDTAYSFDLLYQDRNADSSLYLEAVRDSGGNVLEIRRLDDALAEELLLDLEGAHVSPNDSGSKPSDGSKPDGEVLHGPYNFDATFNWIDRGISATDNFSRDDVSSIVTSWMNECDRQQGAYILETESSGSGTTYYIYYNGGGQYPWMLNVEGGQLIIELYSNSPLVTNKGYHLMKITLSQDYSAIKLYLDDTELNLAAQ